MRTEIVTYKAPEIKKPVEEVKKSILPQYNDMVFESILLEESFVMSGTRALMHLADYHLADVGYASDITFLDEVQTHIMLNSAATPKLLKQLGWNIESDGSTRPMVATVPRYLSKGTSKKTGFIEPPNYYELKLNKYSKVVLDYDYSDSGRIFQVTDVTSNMFNPVFYYMKLVPYHDRVEVDPSPVNDPNLTHLTKNDESIKHLTFPGSRCPDGKTPVIY